MSREDELHYAIALGMVHGIGPVTARRLIEHFGSAQEVFRQSAASLSELRGIRRPGLAALKDRAVLERAANSLEQCLTHGIAIRKFDDADFPERLNRCPDAPYILFSKGSCSLNAKRVVSVVGSRSSTSYGARMTDELIRGLAGHGVLVVSGLAVGIDGSAHRSCLGHGVLTTAVLAHGPELVYPFVHRRLADEILAAGGSIVTEYPWGTRLSRMQFPARNRIVAGLSDAVVVVESAEKGGALITADLAGSYHREVFAFPGRVGDPRSAGCLELIRSNAAALIRNGADLLEMLNWNSGLVPFTNRKRQPPPGLSDVERSIFDHLYGVEASVSMEEILYRNRSRSQSVRSALLRLEMLGLIRSAPGNSFSKA